jgi:hypothetical protein
MSEIKITSAAYIWAGKQTPCIQLELDLRTPDGPQHTVVIVAGIHPLLFENGLVSLHG